MTLGQGNLLYNRYRVVEILGRGGMGAVYRAIDESLGVEVAVKENLFTTDDYARQFRMEAVILAGIRHPNLPRVTDHFVIDDMGQYLVMDYIEGDDLRQCMEKSGPISEDEAIRIGAAACDALTYLHTRKPPILHRDIKLGNIKISSDGHVYLVDFGLAKMGWEHEETMTGARAMTPGYSPPEQYGSARTDARSDIYSLGATLYAALTGVIPEDSLMRAVDGVILTPLRDHRPEISIRLALVIEKALETASSNRYQSADAFKQALLGQQQEPAQVVEEAPPVPVIVEHKSTPLPAVPEQKKSASAWRLFGYLLVVLAIAAGVIVINPSSQKMLQSVFFPVPILTPTRVLPLALPSSSPTAFPLATASDISKPAPAATITTFPTDTPTPQAQATIAITGTLPADTAVPVQKATPQGGGTGEIAFASIEDRVAQIFIVNADGTNLRRLTTNPKGACSFDWSPDGTQLVYISPCTERTTQYPKSGLYLFDINSDSTTPLPFKQGGDFEPAWSPDGSKIAFTSLRDGTMQIYVYKLSDSSLTPLTVSTPGGNLQSRYPAWSPDSSQIVFTAMRVGLLQIWLMSADGSNKRQLVRTGGSFSDYLPSWSPDGTILFFSETNGPLTAPSSLVGFNLQTGKMMERLPLPQPVVDSGFSPDGQWIAYEFSDTKNQDIYIWHMPEGSPQRLTTSPQVDFDPVWRPGK